MRGGMRCDVSTKRARGTSVTSNPSIHHHAKNPLSFKTPSTPLCPGDDGSMEEERRTSRGSGKRPNTHQKLNYYFYATLKLGERDERGAQQAFVRYIRTGRAMRL